MFFFTTYTIYIIIIHMYIYFSVIVILSLNKFLIANAQLDIKKKKRFYPGSFAPAQITCTLILLLNIFKDTLIK